MGIGILDSKFLASHSPTNSNQPKKTHALLAAHIMPKRRILQPDSIFARSHLEKWIAETMLDDDHAATKAAPHRARIWKHYTTSAAATPTDPASIQAVPGIPNVVKEQFDQHFVQCTSTVVEIKESDDGAKLVVELQDGHRIETVLIRHSNTHSNPESVIPSKSSKSPATARNTVCVSSQVRMVSSPSCPKR